MSKYLFESDMAARRSIEKIGFIGAGNMAFAIAQGIVRNGSVDAAKQFFVYAPSMRNLPKFQKEFKCKTSNDIQLLENNPSDLVFVCVKPSILHQPLLKLKNNPLVVSVAAGVSIESLKKSIVAPSGYFVRIMTNTCCAIGASVCATCIDPMIQDEARSQLETELKSFLSPLGEVNFVEESHLNTITALAGSGPAFGLMFLQSMSDGAVKMGLPRSLATRIAAQTLLGASSMVLSTEEHPMSLRDKVCSPGGTTIHGIHALERSSFTAGVIDAIEAATKRAMELASTK
jgi:pyrroline-5-carboxylate reductase